MITYDFILFENFHWAINHYKDVVIIAKMLAASGFRVAIADVFQEAKYCQTDESIPHIKIKEQIDFNILKCSEKSGLNSFITNSLNKIKIDNYLNRVVKEIIPSASNFYVGSYHSAISSSWLKLFPSDKKVFLWGLRSYRLYEYKIRPFSPVGINSFFLRRFVDKHNNICFFLSDELIKREFLQLGIEGNRLLIRPERFTEKIQFNENNSSVTTFFSIGSIRPNKRVELIIEAVKRSSVNLKYILAGKASDSYENLLKRMYNNIDNIIRLNYRIPESEYNSIFENSDFLILCDKQQKSLVTNGTLSEALLKGIPVIAPDYDPYRFVLQKYHVGILFDPDDVKSLVSTIREASKLGKEHYKYNLLAYQSENMFNNISNKFGKDLKCFLEQK